MLGDRVKKRREELGMTQEELAYKLGYKSRSSINKIESGESDIPQSKIKLFADNLKTSPAYLLGLNENKKTDPEIHVIERARKNMPEKDRTRMMNILKATFEEYFDDEES